VQDWIQEQGPLGVALLIGLIIALTAARTARPIVDLAARVLEMLARRRNGGNGRQEREVPPLPEPPPERRGGLLTLEASVRTLERSVSELRAECQEISNALHLRATGLEGRVTNLEQSMNADGQVASRSDVVQLARTMREAIVLWNRLMAPPDVRAAKTEGLDVSELDALINAPSVGEGERGDGESKEEKQGRCR